MLNRVMSDIEPLYLPFDHPPPTPDQRSLVTIQHLEALPLDLTRTALRSPGQVIGVTGLVPELTTGGSV